MANASNAQILITQRRQSAARLLEAVLEERMEARVAINSWPEPLRQLPVDKQPDPSLEAAYQALWYFEADEERHHTEMFYLDAQLELLRQMAAMVRAMAQVITHLKVVVWDLALLVVWQLAQP